MSFGITALFYVLILQTTAKRRWESEGIGITRPTVLSPVNALIQYPLLESEKRVTFHIIPSYRKAIA